MIPGKVVHFLCEDETVGMTMSSCDDSVVVKVTNFRSEQTESFLLSVADCLLLEMFISEVVGRDA